MNDTTLTPPHRRRAATPEAEAAAEAPVETKPKTSTYVVKGADIWTSRGRHKEGATVELTAAEAKHFVKHNLLAPYIPGEEHEG